MYYFLYIYYTFLYFISVIRMKYCPAICFDPIRKKLVQSLYYIKYISHNNLGLHLVHLKIVSETLVIESEWSWERNWWSIWATQWVIDIDVVLPTSQSSHILCSIYLTHQFNIVYIDIKFIQFNILYNLYVLVLNYTSTNLLF